MNETIYNYLLSEAPSALLRAQRVSFAVSLIESRVPVSVAVRRLRDRYRCSTATAYRTIDHARDLSAA